MDLREIIGTHQPDKAGQGEAFAQRGQCIDGITRTEAGLDPGNLDSGVMGGVDGVVEPLAKRRHAIGRFQRVLRRHQPPHFV